MKKFLLVLFTVSFLLTVAGVVSAAPITFTDTTYFTSTGTIAPEDYDDHFYGTVNKLDGSLDYVQWTHYFDFDPAAAEILNATLTLEFKDDQSSFFGMKFDDLAPEYGGGYAEDFTWDFGEINTGDYSYSVTGSFLMDGEFQVTVGSVLGDFYICKSDLEITYNPVPEPSTMLLLGAGLMGLAGFGRKKFKK